jgi:hypothetical protein
MTRDPASMTMAMSTVSFASAAPSGIQTLVAVAPFAAAPPSTGISTSTTTVKTSSTSSQPTAT